MIEELLKLFITEIDTNLLKGVELKDFKTSNIQHTNKVDFLHSWINEGSVAKINKPHE